MLKCDKGENYEINFVFCVGFANNRLYWILMLCKYSRRVYRSAGLCVRVRGSYYCLAVCSNQLFWQSIKNSIFYTLNSICYCPNPNHCHTRNLPRPFWYNPRGKCTYQFIIKLKQDVEDG